MPMAGEPLSRHARTMAFHTHTTDHPSPAGSARALACAAGELRLRAARSDVPSDDAEPILTSIAEALHDLERALSALGARDGFDHAPDDRDAVVALRWHLTETARRVRDARAGSEECARWARRLAERADRPPPAGADAAGRRIVLRLGGPPNSSHP